MDLITTIVKGYDLSGGAANWTSADLSDFTNYYLDFIWSNVTGTLDGSLLIRQTSDSILYDSIETFTIDTADETRLKNNIGLSKDKIDIKFTPNSITGGRLTIKLRALESNLQAHKSNDSIHFTEESIDHTNIQNVGTNTHPEIDTHIALTNEHIDWTNTSENLKTTGDGEFGQSLTAKSTNAALTLGNTGVGNTDVLIGRAGGAGFHVSGTVTGDLAIRPEAEKRIVFGTTTVVGGTGVKRMIIEAGGNVTMYKDLLFVGSGSGLVMGSMSVNDNSVVTSVSSAGFTQVTIFDTNGHNNNTTPDHTNDHVLIDIAGIYMCSVCATITNQSGAGHKIELVVAKNNGSIFSNMRRHRTLASGSDAGALPICNHIQVAVNDTVEVWVTSDSGALKDIIIEDISINLTLVGGM